MITGFNTDVEHNGVVYHVQTEDKGLESPLILSLVFSGGEILASKRSPYEDLVAAGFSETALAERLKRQHTLICAAINAGRIEDLKRMTAAQAAKLRAEAEAVEQKPAAPEYKPVVPETVSVPKQPDVFESVPPPQQFEPVVEQRHGFLDAAGVSAAGGEFDRKRDAIEPAADLADDGRVVVA